MTQIMDDLGSAPISAATIERWISASLRRGEAQSFIADQILKRWTQNRLSPEAKHVVGVFCLLNDFRESLVNAVRSDLRSQSTLCWRTTWQLVSAFELTRDEVTQVLTGAAAQSQMLALASAALESKHPDKRWKKVFESELQSLRQKAIKEKEKLLSEIEVFTRENMMKERREAVDRILALFPGDEDALKISGDYQEREIDEVITEIRRQYRQNPQQQRRRFDDVAIPPEFANALEQVAPTLDLTSSYELAVGLSQMNFHEEALKILRLTQAQWTSREKVYEVELSLNCQLFAEALVMTQNVRQEFPFDPEIIHVSIYYEAKALYGLNEKREALIRIKELAQARPSFKDVLLLVKEWESRL